MKLHLCEAEKGICEGTLIERNLKKKKKFQPNQVLIISFYNPYLHPFLSRFHFELFQLFYSPMGCKRTY